MDETPPAAQQNPLQAALPQSGTKQTQSAPEQSTRMSKLLRIVIIVVLLLFGISLSIVAMILIIQSR